MVIHGVAVDMVAIEQVAIIISGINPSGHVVADLHELVTKDWAVLHGQESHTILETLHELGAKLGLLVVGYIDKGNARATKPAIASVGAL